MSSDNKSDAPARRTSTGKKSAANPRFPNSSKKIQKKACQTLASSARGELGATNALISSFKKKFKKVKKKLVRALEI